MEKIFFIYLLTFISWTFYATISDKSKENLKLFNFITDSPNGLYIIFICNRLNFFTNMTDMGIYRIIIIILVSKLLFRDKEDPNNMINQFAAVYSNCGFIGIPLINSVLGSEGVFYLTAYMTVFNILTWTHGLSLMKGHFDPKLLKEGLTAPMVIGTFIAMILFFTQIHIPDTIAASMQYIADMNTPLAMMVAGFSVANSDIKKICTNVQIYRIALTKLIIVPLVVLLFLWIAPFNADIAYPTLIASACPTGTTITMMSIRFDKNAAYASEIFSFTTVLSIITIPLIIFIAGFLL